MNTLCQSNNRSLFVGLLIMVIGVGFLFRQLDFFPYEVERALFTWPVILILVGLYFLACRESLTSGFILLTIGVVFWLHHFLPFYFNFRNLTLPIILIGVGIIIISKHAGRRKSDNETQDSPNISFGNSQEVFDNEYFTDTNVFGGSNKMITTKNLRGGKITSLFGGSELNLSRAELSKGINVIDVLYIFGGSSIIVPWDWTVHIDVVSIFGGFSDKRMLHADEQSMPEKTLYIKGTVLFGGGEIKRY